MDTVANIEQERRSEQLRIDGMKDSKERNRLGQFVTPPALSLEIAKYIRRHWGERGSVRFLDPAIGTGSFYSALLQTFAPDQVECATGIEIDAAFASAANELWGTTGLQVIEGDFTRQTRCREFNLVLTNPPYVRHHHLTGEDKKRLRAMTRELVGIDPSGLSGLYCYFLFLAHGWMADEALGVWLIPSEFMDVNYGRAVKQYLTKCVTLLHVHRYDAEEMQFDDALVTSAIVVFINRLPNAADRAKFSFGGTLLAPATFEDVPICELRDVRKWTDLPHRRTTDAPNQVRLGDLFTIKRGLATGSNSFFIVSRADARRHGIPDRALKPVLPSPRYLTEVIVESDADGWPVLPSSLALIDCSLPEDQLQRLYPRFWSYLEAGIRNGIDRGYLTSRRTPWYSQEQRGPAPFLCTYMGRQRGSVSPFRFIWNRSLATAANVYLMLYPKPMLARALRRDECLAADVFEALCLLTGERMVQEGRVYGGGLHKIEPMELANLPAKGIAAVVGIKDCAAQLTLGFEKAR